MSTRAPLQPAYSRTGIPDRDTVRERRIAQHAATGDAVATENAGAGNRIKAADRPYQGVPRPEPSHYLWAHALWGGAPSPRHHKRSGKRARLAR